MDNFDTLLRAGNDLFNPDIAPGERNVATRIDGIITVLTIYQWPEDRKLTAKEKLLVLSYLTPFGKSDDESPSRWATWLYTYINLSFEMMKDSMKRYGQREYRFEDLNPELIDLIIKSSEIALQTEDQSDNSAYANCISLLKFPVDFPSLDVDVENFPEDLTPSRTQYAVYGYCGLLIFLAGKQINDKNSTTIEEKRPQNLIATYKINEEARYFLTGNGKLRMNALRMCNAAWALHYPIRKAIITEVATFSSGQSMPMRIVYTVSKLLEYVGMQQAFYIHKFLLAFPEAKSYACLKSALSAYSSSLLKLSHVNPTIRPYFKVIEGDQTKAFHRNSILPLAAVAINYEQHFNPTVRNYNLGEGAMAAIARFEEEAKRLGHKTLSSFKTEEESALMN